MNKKLKSYQSKRNFKKTQEPVGKVEKNKQELSFVVQHHLARRDHYDFRLEWEGVLKSWAVPKGPSYNPEEKRLAIEVEDHPISYRDFEGIIPQGEYGGGTVMLWDEGTWVPLFKPNKEAFKFTLFGQRLKGTWTLVHLKAAEWLLIKEKDQFSKKTTGITRFNTSIRTGRKMAQIADER